jgi:CheY-like chemotaxis protein
LQGVRVLVVDDDDDVRVFVTFLLQQYGATVTTVASAAEALKAFAQAQPDILISDIGMPQVDGYALMRQVRQFPPEQGGRIPGLALTAYAGEIDYQQAISAGFQHHLAKPVEPEALIEAVANLVKAGKRELLIEI